MGLLLLPMILSTAPAKAVSRAQLGLVCTPTGTAGGQCNGPTGVAVNRTGAGGVTPGDLYVADRSNHRVVQFHAEGDFVAVFGKGVNQTTGADICTAVSGNTCKGGTNVATAGSNWNASGVAVDQATGNVFVYAAESPTAGGRVNVFSAQGAFQGAFGWKVNATTPEAKLQYCTTATGCLSGEANGGAGGFGAANAVSTRTMQVADDGHLYLPDPGNVRIDEFSITLNGSNEVTDVEFVRGLGWKVSAATPEDTLQSCTVVTGCLKGTPGSEEGQFPANNPVSVAVDSGGSVYAVTARSGTLACSPTDVCRVQKFNADGSFKELFGPATGECQLRFESGVANTQQAMAVAVDPSNQRVLVLKKTSGNAMKICEFDSSGAMVGSYPLAELPVNSSTALSAGLAVGTGELLYAVNGTPGAYILGPAPPAGAEIVPVTEIGQTTATLHGIATVPLYKGNPFPTFYQFEVSGNGGFTWESVTVPIASAGSIAGPVEVHQAVSGLMPNVNYLARLAATTSGTTTSTSAAFTTAPAAPVVSYALGANPLTDVVDPFGPTSAKLAGYVNPNSSPTTYRFEYGTTDAYGAQSPSELEPFVGAGGSPVAVKANLSGLQPDTVYHYRIVATNATGTTFGTDQQFNTAEALQALNSCGLPDSRCLELVSPSDKGPVAAAETAGAGADLQFQASSDGSGIAYQIANGLPDATAPNEVLYGAERSAGGWSSAQLGPPLISQSELRGESAQSGRTRALSADLSCGVVVSPAPLTADTPTRVIEAGGANLFRRDNDTGTYRIITSLPPTNAPLPTELKTLEFAEYEVIGISQDCERVTFSTPYQYPGIPGGGAKRLYEWDGASIRNVGWVPTSSTPAAAAATAGDAAGKNHLGAVSSDGTQVVFTAVSQVGADAGRTAVFARVDGLESIDLSQSQTAVPTNGAKYQAASRGGDRVFFTANYGITAESSAGPTNANCSTASFSNDCDLYEYDFNEAPGARLTNLSGDLSSEESAQVAGVTAVSDDGAYVYFAARGQLVPGEGPTLAQNQAASTFSLYLAHGGRLKFVGVVDNLDLVGGVAGATNSNVLMSGGTYWAARATPDGRHFVFSSSADVTGYVSGGPAQAYVFSADSGATVCVSCRRDGQPSVAAPMGPLVDFGFTATLEPRVSITADGSRIYFASKDALAPGAAAGRPNLYEWSRGQVYLLVSQPPGFFVNPAFFEAYAGASADGSSVFFTTPEALTWEDKDLRDDLYVARVNGGFSPPPPAPPPCNPLSEGSCQGGSSGAVLGATPPASQGFVGPGNESGEPEKAKKKSKKKKSKKKNKKKKGNGKRARGADANVNRRASK